MDWQSSSELTTVAAHPTNQVLAVGTLDGQLSFLRFTETCADAPFVTSRTVKHKRTVRRARFAEDGHGVYCVTKNKALILWNVETGKKTRCIRVAHESAPYALCVVDACRVATSDEDGCVKVWDWRTPAGCVAVFDEEVTDCVTDLVVDAEKRFLLGSCADNTLLTFNLKKRKFIHQSEAMHAELHALAFTPDRQRLLAGAEDGYIEIFKTGEYSNILERFETKHKDSVDMIASLDDGLVATGSADGDVRLHHVLPNHSLGVVHSHEEPVTDLAALGDWLLSTSYDCKLKARNWREKMDAVPDVTPETVKKRKGLKRKLNVAGGNSFFDGLNEA